jgi:hypothetical protein
MPVSMAIALIRKVIVMSFLLLHVLREPTAKRLNQLEITRKGIRPLGSLLRTTSTK